MTVCAGFGGQDSVDGGANKRRQHKSKAVALADISLNASYPCEQRAG